MNMRACASTRACICVCVLSPQVWEDTSNVPFNKTCKEKSSGGSFNPHNNPMRCSERGGDLREVTQLLRGKDRAGRCHLSQWFIYSTVTSLWSGGPGNLLCSTVGTHEGVCTHCTCVHVCMLGCAHTCIFPLAHVHLLCVCLLVCVWHIHV